MGLFDLLRVGITRLSGQNKILSEYISNLALAVIGEGWKIEDKVAASVSYDKHVMDFFKGLDVISRKMDALFISPLEALFPRGSNKYFRLITHFERFKEAHLNPVIGTLISDRKIQDLVLGDIRWKICEDLSVSESRDWLEYHRTILDFLAPVVEAPRKVIGSYEDGIVVAFLRSAYKLNSDVLSFDNCSSFHDEVFSEPLIKILATHFEQIEFGYKSICQEWLR